MQPPPRVLILLCTRNGARWLPEQLASIAAQTFRAWTLWVSDDGSADGTPDIVRAFALQVAGQHAVTLVEGPGQGAAQNFLSLATHPDLPVGPCTYVAFCDQDDVWLPDKLATALAALRTLLGTPGQPSIYGAQSVHIDADGREVGTSRRPIHAIHLQNAVVQNMVSGHSMVLNPAAVATVRRSGRHQAIEFHDWWVGLLVLAVGGQVIVENRVVLRYRQHASNVIGAPGGLLAHLRRLGSVRTGHYRMWVAANLAALDLSPVPLTAQAQRIVDRLSSGPTSGLGRVRTLRTLGVHRHGRISTLVLYLAAVFGRV